MKTLPSRGTRAPRAPLAWPATPPSLGRGARWSALALALVLTACASAPPRPVVHRHAPRAAQPLYFYPQYGQNERRQDRDRYECYQWASRQTHSDPGMTPLRTYAHAAPPAPAPGRDTAIGAVTGAAIGGAVASRHHTAEGAVVGLVLGALIGAASDQARADAARQAQATYAAHGPSPWHDFRRAMSACMTGRGYTVG